MTDKEFVELCKLTVAEYFNSHSDKTDKFHLNVDDVYIVWQCRALQNWKALVSTTVADGMYYEVTHNGDRNETYIDCYKKWDNFTVK